MTLRVLVTGAASGFGDATMTELLRRGCDVRGIDLIDGPGITRCDVRNGDGVRAAVEAVASELGGLDALVNSAGIGSASDPGLPPEDHALATIDVNLLGPWRTTAAALPHLLASGGAVVNVASGLAYLNLPYTAAYAMSKRGLAAYGDALRLHHGDRVRVVTVYPGYVRTPIHDRAGQQGYSLAGAIPEDRLERVVATIVRACYGRGPREAYTSLTTRLGVTCARYAPRLTDAFVGLQVRRALRRGNLMLGPSPAERFRA